MRLKLWTTDPDALRVEAVTPIVIPTWATGRIVTQEYFHLGLRPNFYYTIQLMGCVPIGREVAGAITLQIRFDEVLR